MNTLTALLDAGHRHLYNPHPTAGLSLFVVVDHVGLYLYDMNDKGISPLKLAGYYPSGAEVEVLAAHHGFGPKWQSAGGPQRKVTP